MPAWFAGLLLRLRIEHELQCLGHFDRNGKLRVIRVGFPSSPLRHGLWARWSGLRVWELCVYSSPRMASLVSIATASQLIRRISSLRHREVKIEGEEGTEIYY